MKRMDDLISRQQAIDAIEKTKSAISEDGERYVAKINAQQNIALLPSAQLELDSEALIHTIEMGITATNSNDIYSLGMRNGMRWCKSLIDGVEPKFEDYVTSVDDWKELPSTQPERKQGRWIYKKINEYTSRTYCSECGKSALFICVSDDYYGNRQHGETIKTKFCPNCGAKMESEGHHGE